MNSSGQNVATDPLLGVGANAAAGDRKGATTGSNKENNSLNNKEFSDVLDDQKSVEEAVESEPGKSVTTATTSGESEPKKPVLTFSKAVRGLLLNGATGNTLPADGLTLPPPFAAQQDVEAEGSLWLIDDGQIDTDQSVTNATNSGIAEEAVANVVQTPEAVTTAPAAPVQQNRGDKPVSNPAGTAAQQPTPQAASVTAAVSDSAATKTAAVESTVVGDSRANNAAVTPPLTVSELSRQLQFKSQQLTDSSSVATAVSSATDSDENTVLPPGPVTKTGAPGAYREPANATLQTAVPVEVGKPGWSENVMQRVMWMSSQNVGKAEIALDPPELGPLQVRISTHADQTSVTFTSNHGAVRDALDQGLPRLREMMENQGLNLADVDVSQQNSQQQAEYGAEEGELAASGNNADASADNENSADDHARQPLQAGRPLSLVDHYV